VRQQFPLFVIASPLTYITVDHWHDVLVGSAVGTLLSYFAYRQYYPSLVSPMSHQPYSPRIAREAEQEVLPTHSVCPSFSSCE